MACIRGRCPCWPQAEPFDDAEMHVLTFLRDNMMAITCLESDSFWAKLQSLTQAVRCHRRAYVLSTFVNYQFSVTLLGHVSSCTSHVQWLLDVGVCPNMGSAWSRPRVRTWTGGPVHPGRPAQTALCSPLDRAFVGDGTVKLLLLAGAYPVQTRRGVLPLPLLRCQWRAWHARASRRLWAALTARS
jgi:hypothetical protein